MIGIDEVGRGCWAGPLLVVAARQTGSLPESITDSKALKKADREGLLGKIINNCDIGEGWVSAKEIDEAGLSQAMRIAVARALSQVGALDEEPIVIDGHINYCPAEFKSVEAIVKADFSVPIVGAASIYAKVTRDKYMSELTGEYTKYQFYKHVGYGTALHKQMLMLYGISDLHRRSYKPIKTIEGII